MARSFPRALALVFLACFAPLPAAAQWDWLPFLGPRAETRPLAEQEERASVLMGEANRAREAGRASSAARLYRRLARAYPASSYAPHALFHAGKIEFERKRYRQAFDAYQALLRGYPDFPNFNLIVGDQFELASKMMEKRKRFLFFKWGDQENAIRFFEQLIANAPYSDYAPLALMNLATIHRDRGDIPEAIDALDRLINFYPSSMLAPDAYLNLAEIYADLVNGPAYDQGATREALSYFDDFLILYPNSPQVARGEKGRDEMRETLARSKFDIGVYYFRYRKNYEAARVFLNEAITVSPDSPSSVRARQYLDRIDAMPPPAPAAAKPKRRGFNLFFWRRGNADAPVIETNEAPLSQDYSRGDRPSVAAETISAPPPAEEERGSWLGRLWPFSRRNAEPATTPAAPAPEPAEPERVPPTRP